jgi:hypothetical protein
MTRALAWAPARVDRGKKGAQSTDSGPLEANRGRRLKTTVDAHARFSTEKMIGGADIGPQAPFTASTGYIAESDQAP